MTIVPSVCGDCGGRAFLVLFDDVEGGAEHMCVACGGRAFIADSEEFWEDVDPGEAGCPCGSREFEAAVAFSLADDGSVRWVTVGLRCRWDGAVGVYADWKIDYGPTDHLLTVVQARGTMARTGCGFLAGAVAEHREDDVGTARSEAEQSLSVVVPSGDLLVVVGPRCEVAEGRERGEGLKVPDRMPRAGAAENPTPAPPGLGSGPGRPSIVGGEQVPCCVTATVPAVMRVPPRWDFTPTGP
ncbi:hypothetical protein [Streptomyces sp. NPDC057939]|uniref:hypothetical protein n=1 Tax=Streptomyces sp. NPDC057939 TaxID=3346284 RepID=UPI0036EB075E